VVGNRKLSFHIVVVEIVVSSSSNNNNNNNNNNNYNVPVAAERRLQKQHKITKYKPNITQLHCKYTRDMTENVLSYTLTYATK